MAGAVAVGAVVSVMGGLSHVVAELKRSHPALDVRLIGAKAEAVVTRLLGVLLAALAAQYVIDGLRAVLIA